MKDFPKEEAEEEVKYKIRHSTRSEEKGLCSKNKEKPSDGPKNRRPPRTTFAVAISQQQWKCRKKGTKLKEEKRKRGPNLTEPPPPELRNEREDAGRRKGNPFRQSIREKARQTKEQREKAGEGPAFNPPALKGKWRPQDAKENPCRTKDGKEVAKTAQL